MNGRRKGSDMSQEPLREIGPNVSEQDAKLVKAKRQVAAIKGFYVHLSIFALVMLGMGAINFAVGRPWWVLWVLLGWGIGVLAHALTVFARTSRRIADWEERKIRQLMSES
jgi:fatty acid desaturase